MSDATPKWACSLKDLLKVVGTRQQAKATHSLADSHVSAFAVFFLQDPSLLEFRRRFQQQTQRNNLSTVFDIGDIPSDTQLRELLDTHDYAPDTTQAWAVLLETGRKRMDDPVVEIDSLERTVEYIARCPVDGVNYSSISSNLGVTRSTRSRRCSSSSRTGSSTTGRSSSPTAWALHPRRAGATCATNPTACTSGSASAAAMLPGRPSAA